MLKDNDQNGNHGKALDLDQLYEYNLKIFGDVFESIIGAVFIDSESIEVTWTVLWGLMEDYIKVYANLETLQDHSRTKLLELWNQKVFMRDFKCKHETKKPTEKPDHITFLGLVEDKPVLEVDYHKDAKNKVRSFYRQYYQLMSCFFEHIKNKEIHTCDKEKIVDKIIKYRDGPFKQKLLEEEKKKQLEEEEKLQKLEAMEITTERAVPHDLISILPKVEDAPDNLLNIIDDKESIYGMQSEAVFPKK